MYVLDFDDVSQNLKKYFIVARGGGDEGTAWSYNNQGKSWIVDEEKMPKPFSRHQRTTFFTLQTANRTAELVKEISYISLAVPRAGSLHDQVKDSCVIPGNVKSLVKKTASINYPLPFDNDEGIKHDYIVQLARHEEKRIFTPPAPCSRGSQVRDVCIARVEREA